MTRLSVPLRVLRFSVVKNNHGGTESTKEHRENANHSHKLKTNHEYSLCFMASTNEAL